MNYLTPGLTEAIDARSASRVAGMRAKVNITLTVCSSVYLVLHKPLLIYVGRVGRRVASGRFQMYMLLIYIYIYIYIYMHIYIYNEERTSFSLTPFRTMSRCVDIMEHPTSQPVNLCF